MFKIFDRVLVRDSVESIWLPAFYARHTIGKTERQYITIGGKSYKFCIRFDGNEQLAFTTGNNKIVPDLKFGDKIMVKTYPSDDWRQAIFHSYNSDPTTPYIAVLQISENRVLCTDCKLGW